MDPVINRIVMLLRAYLDGVCSGEEYGELLELWPLGAEAPEVQEVLQAALLQAGHNPAEELVDWEGMLERIVGTREEKGGGRETGAGEGTGREERRMGQGNEAEQETSVGEIIGSEETERGDSGTGRVVETGGPRWRVWAAAAAAVILLLGTIGYFRWHRAGGGSEDVLPVINFAEDVKPGGNKAILTLAGGQQIVLDSAANGNLGKQGSADIIKTDSGKLVYMASVGGDGGNVDGNGEGVGGKTRSAGGKAGKVVYNTLSTPRGGQYQLTLSDGTRVWLNAASSITYPTAFMGVDREVTIKGEAYFEVAKNVHQPFKVIAGKMKTTVLGTSFNINAYEDEPVMRTTLAEGSVRVSEGVGDDGKEKDGMGNDGNSKAGNGSNGRKNDGKGGDGMEGILLQAGQQAKVSQGGKVLGVEAADVEQALAWKNGLFKLDGAEIQEIMRQAARWYDVEISYEGDLGKAVFSGVVSRGQNISRLLTILQTTGSVHFAINDKKVTVKP